MDKTQLACVAVRALPHYEEEAKERQLSTLKRGEEMPDVEKIPQREEQSRSRDLAAVSVGVNPRYVSDAKRIQQESPKTFRAMQEGKITIQQAKASHKAGLDKRIGGTTKDTDTIGTLAATSK